MSKLSTYNCGCINNGNKCKEHKWLSMQNIDGLPPFLIDIAYLLLKWDNVQKAKKATNKPTK